MLMFKSLNNTVKIAQDILKNRLKPGDVVIDATAGNGNDTLFLAKLVGQEGRVYSFDVQAIAIETTLELITKNGVSANVKLFHDSHEKISELVTEKVDAIIFNLGYLPGGSHDFTTTSATTVRAVSDGLTLLKPGGTMCIVVYIGHESGQEEKHALEQFLRTVDKKNYCVAKLDFLNRNKAPYILLVEKSDTAGGPEF